MNGNDGLAVAERAAHSRAAPAHAPATPETAMSPNQAPYRADPSLPRRCIGTLAVGVAAALAAGALVLLQSGCTDDQMALTHSATATDAQSDATATPRRAAAARTAPLDTGVDWSRVEPLIDTDGASVAAYER
jgi:hypothetical protein